MNDHPNQGLEFRFYDPSLAYEITNLGENALRELMRQWMIYGELAVVAEPTQNSICPESGIEFRRLRQFRFN